MNQGIYRSIFLLYFINFVMFLSFHNIYDISYKTFIIYITKNLICFFFFIFVTKINLNMIRNNSFLIYITCVFLLIYVHFFGTIGLGARRWINLKFFYLQPSEFLKICLPIYLCDYLTKIHILTFKNIIIFILKAIFPIILVIIEPDLGTGIILIIISGSILFLAGLHIRYICIITCITLLICPIIWNSLYNFQKQRILTFISHKHMNKSNYQIYQSRITIGSGGLCGKGFLKGSQFRFHFLPKPETDFIFSCICEEWGFLGGLCVTMIFFYLTLVSLITIFWKQNLYECYLACSIAVYIFFSFFFNVAMTMSLIPTVGVPLPILSYGGSSTLTFLSAVGLLINIRKH
jgi:rod shape determining protein RodA